ncbi:hypothetical protein [Paramylibacter kogurei]|nr:hypothetical protein [Amylibacter kogurei]
MAYTYPENAQRVVVPDKVISALEKQGYIAIENNKVTYPRSK